MLTTIREKTQGIIATFIVALIVIPFALWGVNSYFDGGTRTSVATVNGDEVSEQSYRIALDRFQRQVDSRKADSPEFKKMVVDGLVEQTLLSRDIDRQGYRIGDLNLAESIRSLPNFQTDGKFDPARYESTLRRENLTVHEFENRVRIDIANAQMRAGYSLSALVTQAEFDGLVRLLGQQRDLAYAVITAEKFSATAVIKPETIQQYYEAHPDSFRIPEQVRVEYVQLSAASLTKNYQPTDTDLRNAYADSSPKEKVLRPESRRASHILISVPAGASSDDDKKALAKIEELEKQVRSGVDFAKLAKEKSQDPDSAAKGGDIGAVSREGVLPKTLIDAVQALKVNEISKPVRTEYGYHLVKLTGFTPAVLKPFESMKPSLAKRLQQHKSEEAYYEASEKFRNLVYEQADSLASAAEALGLKIEKSEWFDRNGGPGIAARPRVVEAAFSPEVLTQRRNSDAVDIAGDTLLALRIAEHRPAALKSLADVRSQIERVLRQEAAQKAAREQGEKLIQELKAGRPLELLARQYGLKFNATKTVSRDGTKGFDGAVVAAAFEAPRPEAGKASQGGVDLGSTGYAVYAVTKVVDADASKADAVLREKAKNVLATQSGQGAYADYVSRLRKTADIEVFENSL